MDDSEKLLCVSAIRMPAWSDRPDARSCRREWVERFGRMWVATMSSGSNVTVASGILSNNEKHLESRPAQTKDQQQNASKSNNRNASKPLSFLWDVLEWHHYQC